MPIRLDYQGSPLRLAASLGDIKSRQLLIAADPSVQIDDAFEVLMSCCDVGDVYDRYAPPRLWPYTLESAMRMAIATYRGFLPDWAECFERRENIPAHVPADFAPKVADMVSRWIVDPVNFTWEEYGRAYEWIKDDICLDGYLSNDNPRIPKVVSSCCYSALFLIEIQNIQSDAGRCLAGYDPAGVYSANMPDAIGWFINEGMDEARIRSAICHEVIPWCLGEHDPLCAK